MCDLCNDTGYYCSRCDLPEDECECTDDDGGEIVECDECDYHEWE